jgi:hypothetical protein
MTYEASTLLLGSEKLMPFVVGSHVRTSVLAEKASESTVSEVDSGATWQKPFHRLSRESCSWKTRQLWLSEDLEQCLTIWPRWGMMCAGECFELLKFPASTSESEFSFMPTLTKNCPVEKEEIPSHRLKFSNNGWIRKIAKTGVEGSMNWSQWMLCQGFLPTPKAADFFMKFPDEWSALAPLETRKFQQWLASHGKL